MQNSNDIIVSEGDNEFLRLVRENRERRYSNDTTKTTKQDTSDIDSTRVDNAQGQGDTGASKRASSRGNTNQGRGEETSNEKESTASKLRKKLQASVNQEGSNTEDSGNKNSVEVEKDNNEESVDYTDITLNENPLAGARSTKEENFRNLRNALKASNNRVSELETEIAAKEEELKKLESVSELEAKLAEANAKLEKLQKYEDIIGLYGTEGFKEEYYDKVDNIKKDIMSLANDYGVGEDVINQAIGITNQKQLNEFLGQYFDVYSVQDIRKSVKEIQGILNAREEAENNPVKTREYLLTNFAKKKDAMDKQSRENIKLASMSAWTEMSETYSNPASGVDILQEKKGNKEHNETRLGILNNSSQEFGKLVAVLTDNGLRSLPSNVARALASRFQLGETAAYAIVQAESLKKENDELRAELKKFTNYSRPLGSAGSSSAVTGKATATTELKGRDLARYLYSSAENKVKQIQ